MNYPRPVKPEIDRSVRAVEQASQMVGWQCQLHSVARSGRSVYLTITNGQSRFRLRVSDHVSRYYQVSSKARQVLVNRPRTLRAMLQWFHSRKPASTAGIGASAARPIPRVDEIENQM